MADVDELAELLKPRHLPAVRERIARAHGGRGVSHATAGGAGADGDGAQWHETKEDDLRLEEKGDEFQEAKEGTGASTVREQVEALVRQQLSDSVGCELWMRLAWTGTASDDYDGLPAVEVLARLDPVPWPVFNDGLAALVAAQVPAVVSARRLSRNDLNFLRDTIYARVCPREQARTVRNGAILAGHANFWRWFSRVLASLRLLQPLWCQTAPVLLHGFVSRTWAEARLQSCAPGTFIIRFASQQQNAGWLSISFKDTLRREAFRC